MPKELWDTLALLPWLSKIGPYLALTTLVLVATSLAIMRLDDQRVPTKLAKVELSIAISALLGLMMLDSLVGKGEAAIGPHQPWSAVQSAPHGFVTIYTVVLCWVLAAMIAGLVAYRLAHRQSQRARLYGCVAIGCVALSTRAMQLYTLEDAWAMANLLMAVASTASMGLLVSFLRKEWRMLKNDMKAAS